MYETIYSIKTERRALVAYQPFSLASVLAASVICACLAERAEHDLVVPFELTRPVRLSDLAADFELDSSAMATDLYCAGIPHIEAIAKDMVESGLFANLCIFSVACAASFATANNLQKHYAEIKDRRTTQVRFVFSDKSFNLVDLAARWAQDDGYGQSAYEQAALSFARYDFGSHNAGVSGARATLQEVDLAQAAVAYFQSLLGTAGAQCCTLETSERHACYAERFRGSVQALEGGIEAWAAKGREWLSKATHRLQGNLLSSCMSDSGVVLAPDSKSDGPLLLYTLRCKYPQSRAVITHYQLPSGDNVYRLHKGHVWTAGFFGILSNVVSSGIPSTSVCSTLSPARVHRIASSAMALLTKRTKALK